MAPEEVGRIFTTEALTRKTTPSGASLIGMSPIPGLTSDNVQGGIEEIAGRSSSGPELDVREFRQSGDVNDLPMIQRAINRAEELKARKGTNAEFSPVVHFPYGEYELGGGTPVVSRPIGLRGDGRSASVWKSAGDAPLLEVRAHLRTEQPLDAQKPVVQGLGFFGDYPSSKPNQHGIKLSYSADRWIPRVEVTECHINGCGGDGFHGQQSVSNRIYHNIIDWNRGFGIYLTGEFNTDAHIRFNAIRQNLMGIYVNPNAGFKSVTGWIEGNVIEANQQGSGQVGGPTRLATGIRLVRPRNWVVARNYFEFQLNDIRGDDCELCIFEGNFYETGNGVPGTYPGFGGPARRVTPMYFTGANKGNVVRNNTMAKPQRPASTSVADWGGNQASPIPDTYEHLPILQGGPWELAENKNGSVSGAVENVTYRADPNYEIAFRGVRSEGTISRVDEASYERNVEGVLVNYKTNSSRYEGRSVGAAAEQNFVWPPNFTGRDKFLFSLTPRNADGSLGAAVALHRFTPDGVTYPNGRGPIVTSPNGTRYRIIVSDAGALSTVAV